jgi:hypothetical protein
MGGAVVEHNDLVEVRGSSDMGTSWDGGRGAEREVGGDGVDTGIGSEIYSIAGIGIGEGEVWNEGWGIGINILDGNRVPWIACDHWETNVGGARVANVEKGGDKKTSYGVRSGSVVVALCGCSMVVLVCGDLVVGRKVSKERKMEGARG